MFVATVRFRERLFSLTFSLAMPQRKRGPKQTTQQMRDAERARRAMNQARNNESQQETVDLPKVDVSSLDHSLTTNIGKVCIEVLSRSP